MSIYRPNHNTEILYTNAHYSHEKWGGSKCTKQGAVVVLASQVREPPLQVFLTDCTKFISYTLNFLISCKSVSSFEKLKCRASRQANLISFYSNPPTCTASSYVFCPQPRYIAPSALIRKHNAKDVFGVFIFHDLELTLDDFFKIRKERSLKQLGNLSLGHSESREGCAVGWEVRTVEAV